MVNTVVLITNILTPYRAFFYDALYDTFLKRSIDFHVCVCARTEKGRNWFYEDFERKYTKLLPYKSLSFKNRIFLHFNRGLKKLYKQLNPDIIICGGTYLAPSVWETIWLNKKLGAQLYYWSESHLNEKRNYNKAIICVRDLVRKLIYTKMDGFWYSGKLSQEFIIKYCSKDISMIFVPNLVDNSVFEKVKLISNDEQNQIKARYCIEKDKIIFVIPARLTAVKGIIEFLELLDKAISKDKMKVLIVGDGELKNDIVEKIKALHLEKSVKLLGYKNQNEMLHIYAVSDFFLLPSVSDPNPLSVIEACWCSLPLLISEHCGNYYEIVKDGENGFVFSYSDKKNVIELIEKCANSSVNWRKKAGQISYSIVNDIYNPSKTINRVIDEMVISYEEWKRKKKN